MKKYFYYKYSPQSPWYVSHHSVNLKNKNLPMYASGAVFLYNQGSAYGA
ncbi:MAG: hypothetical protein J0H29_14880 [Sphingobacteriales bacterium]|nr:hypothetical protein [Sphingobacteriales bacterium]